MTLIRPLLSFQREEITAYLTFLGQQFRLDSSNLDSRFTRNRIRLELMPRLSEDYNQEVAQALLRLGNVATQAQTVLEDMTMRLHDECLRADDAQSVEVSCTSLVEVDAILVCELFIAIWKSRSWPLQDMGFEKWCELAAMAQGDPSDRITRTFPGGIQASRVGDRLRLCIPIPRDFNSPDGGPG
jgi:tRNA(Ile)-lysidine synthase